MSVLEEALRFRLVNFLQRLGESYVETEGEYLLTRGSAAVVFYISEFDNHMFINFHGAIAHNINPSKDEELELYQTLLSWNVADEFGKFALLDDQVILKYKMLSDDLSFDSFSFVLDTILEYADSFDELVAAIAQGERHIDAVGAQA